MSYIRKNLISLVLFFCFLPSLFLPLLVFAEPVSNAPLKVEEAPPTTPESISKEQLFSEWDKEQVDKEHKEENAMQGLWMKTLALLGAIIAFLFFTTYVVKRFHPSLWISNVKEGGAIKILEKRILSPKSCIYLVEVGDTKMAIAESAAGVYFLCKISTPANF
jgi:flagellar biogenesis protein FliO